TFSLFVLGELWPTSRGEGRVSTSRIVTASQRVRAIPRAFHIRKRVVKEWVQCTSAREILAASNSTAVRQDTQESSCERSRVSGNSIFAAEDSGHGGRATGDRADAERNGVQRERCRAMHHIKRHGVREVRLHMPAQQPGRRGTYRKRAAGVIP